MKKRSKLIIDIESDFTSEVSNEGMAYLVSEDLKDKQWDVHEVKPLDGNIALGDVLENLCVYDRRNPYCTSDDEEIAEHKLIIEKGEPCCCDNCLYGRTKLAEEIVDFWQLYNLKS